MKSQITRANPTAEVDDGTRGGKKDKKQYRRDYSFSYLSHSRDKHVTYNLPSPRPLIGSTGERVSARVCCWLLFTSVIGYSYSGCQGSISCFPSAHTLVANPHKALPEVASDPYPYSVSHFCILLHRRS